MKHTLILSLLLLCGIASLQAKKNIQTLVLTTQPQMHCKNCEKKIKDNLRFVKGVKDIQTSLAEQKVTISYDANKTNPEKIQAGLGKIGYTAAEWQAGCLEKKPTQCQQDDHDGGCCKEKKK